MTRDRTRTYGATEKAIAIDNQTATQDEEGVEEKAGRTLVIGGRTSADASDAAMAARKWLATVSAKKGLPESIPRGRQMTITLPLPPQACKPNGRYHYMARHRATSQYRKWAFLAAKSEIARNRPFVSIRKPTARVTAYWRTTRKMDPDNLLATMKAAFDGFTDAGVWRDDREVTHLPCVQAKDAANPRIEIEVWR